MKKIGSFFFTFIPFLLALVFQYLAMFFVMGVTLFYEHIRYIFSSNRIYADLWNKNIRFMVHDTCKYPDHDCIFPSLYRSIWLLVSCRV